MEQLAGAIAPEGRGKAIFAYIKVDKSTGTILLNANTLDA